MTATECRAQTGYSTGYGEDWLACLVDLRDAAHAHSGMAGFKPETVTVSGYVWHTTIRSLS
jgi:hypothetical protein